MESGYFMEVLTESYGCFQASNYQVLLIIDPEDYFSEEKELAKLRRDVEQEGLSLVIMADWYNRDLMSRNSFFNNNTFEMWTPFMAGANVPSLNALLKPYHVAFGEKVFSGEFYLEKRQVMIDSGTEIIQFPSQGYLVSARLSEESTQIISKGLLFAEDMETHASGIAVINNNERMAPTIGIIDGLPGFNNSGRIVVMTDSACVDSASPAMSKCYWLLERFVKIAANREYRDKTLMADKYRLPKDFESQD